MDPVTMMLIAGATRAVGSVVQGNAAAAAANANATVADQNATIALQQSGAREDQLRRRQGLELGRQAAALAQSGVDITSGSAIRTVHDSATAAELDALSSRYEGQMQAFGFRREASLERQRAKQARQMGYFGAVSSVLTAGAQAYGMRARGAANGSPTPTSSFGGTADTFGPGSLYEFGGF